MRRVTWRASIAIAALLSGCDGFLGVEGRVYEWQDAPSDAKGLVLVDNLEAVPPPDLAPLAGATITVSPWTPSERDQKPEDVRRYLTSVGLSAEDGSFKVGTTVAPGKYESTILVTLDGYKQIEHVFLHDRLFHRAVVVLVADAN